MSDSSERAKMPKGTSTILDNRSLEKDYQTLIPLLKEGMRVLDIGCGTGALTRGMAELVGKDGQVIGIDSSVHLTEKGKINHQDISNLEIICTNLFEYQPERKFDLVVSARVLQWLNNPQEALGKIKTFLKLNGQVSILDYNHTALEWHPQPPQSMLLFYQQFLNWRADAGMNNQIAEDLPNYLQVAGFEDVEIIESNEVYKKSESNFLSKAGIWTKVAESRGQQMVKDGYGSEEARLKAIEEYSHWVETEAEMMIMKLKDVRGKLG